MNRHDYICVNFETIVMSKTDNRAFECNTLVMWNQGTQNVTIGGTMILTPGQAFTFECYPGEMNVKAYDVVFANDREAGCRLICVMKMYLNTGIAGKMI